jgi:hypothetical protein
VPELKAAPHGKLLSMREQMRLPRQRGLRLPRPGWIDRFALENYDGVGRWRGEDAGAPSAQGKLPDGTSSGGPPG